MTPDLDKLAALAGAATPGPWRYPSGGAVVDALGQAVVFGELRPADAAYIAAASPSVVLALIERVRLAGHRTEDCRGLGGEVLRLNRELAERHGWTVEETDGTVRIAAPDPHDAHDDEAAARWTERPLGGGLGG